MRLSGPEALAIAQSLTGRDQPVRAAARDVRPDLDRPAGADVRAVDQVVVTWFAAPHSYTGEDVVEISGHGSPLLLQEIVETWPWPPARGWPSPASSRCARTSTAAWI